MAEITLVAQSGRATGSPESRRLRAAGRIPAVVYGHGIEPESVSVDGRELRLALTGGAGQNQLLSIEVAGTRHLALARVLQRHPVRNTVIHVDFQVVSRTEYITADVPVVLVGEARSVEQAKGMLEQPLQTLTITAQPGSIPNAIEVDISGLTIGDTVRVGQLRLPGGVSTDLDPEEPVVVAEASSVSAEAEELEASDAEAAAEAEAEAGTAEGEAEGGAGAPGSAAEG